MGVAGAETGRVTGSNNSAVEVVSWRQKIENVALVKVVGHRA
jgi:hypothetical protein